MLSGQGVDPSTIPQVIIIRQWIEFWCRWREYLLFGKMLHFPKILPQSDDNNSSAWLSPEEESVAVFVTNFDAGQAKNMTIHLDKYTHTIWRMVVHSLDGETSPPVEETFNGSVVTTTLNPRHVLAVESED